MTRSHLPLVLALAALLLGVSAPPAAAWQEKVDASVLAAAAAGDTEMLVYFAARADLAGAYELTSKLDKGAWVHEQLTATAAASQGALLAQLELLGVEHRAFWITNAVWVRGDLAIVELAASTPGVERVYEVGFGTLDPPVGAEAGSGAELATAAGGNLEALGAPSVWALGITGQGAVVASADTGAEWQHPALLDQYRGWDGVAADHDYNWHLGANPNSGCPEFPSTEPCDDDDLLGGGHGTHTIGTMVGDDGGENQIGMAPDARWIACRNMNFGVGAVPSYLDCMEWFIAPTDISGANPDPSKAPDVVNNSWGCVEACPPPVLKDTLEASRAAGIFYSVSAGNDGETGCSSLAFPLAIYEAAFSVGAVDHRNDQIADFSSRGPIVADVPNPPRVGPDISAPGVGVRSSLKGGTYGSLDGTSMASPHVSGLVALLISANPALRGDVDQLEQIIQSTARPLTTDQGCGDDTSSSVPNNSYGWGRIDALAAVLEVLGINEPPRAADDFAVVTLNTETAIDVLVNDTDPNNDALTVAAVTQGSAGGAVSHDGVTVTYDPPHNFVGLDTFTYTASDGEGGTATARVEVDVRCAEEATPLFSDDFEPQPEEGWTVDTAANANPASAPWTPAPDPFAHSPVSSYVSDATTLDLKDDRLVSPPLALPGASRLAFWHRFEFEGGFDGGVLEVSTDGGATWADIETAGGVFLAGGYNGAISPSYDNPLAGRPAWTAASGDLETMVRVEVDLGALAGAEIRLRWRLGADSLVPGSLPGTGWWIDDVELLEISEVCRFAPVAEDDAATTAADTPVTIAVLANDSDPDGDPLTVGDLSDPAHGSAAVNPDQTVTYTPDPGFVGSDSFTYEACDPDGQCDGATVGVEVEAEPQPAEKITGGGWIPRADGGKATLSVNVHPGEGPPQGRLSYDGNAGGLRLIGTVTGSEMLTAETARLTGSCELDDGTPCTFEAEIEDRGEPGAGVDRFAIRVTSATGSLLHEADSLLGGGNLQIH